MSDEKHETIADIVADIRAQNQGLPEDSNALSPLVCDLLRLADRIEAAAKREREMAKIASKNGADFGQLGNAAAIREALANLVDVIDRCDSGSPLWWHCGAKGVMPLKNAKAALAKPPRNCDMGDAADWEKRFGEECDKGHTCSDCPVGHAKKEMAIKLDKGARCEFVWAQMPYEEGGSK